MRFDLVTLRTLGVVAPRPGVGRLGTVHPHHDPRTGERFAYRTNIAPPSSYEVLVSRNGRERVLATIPVAKPGYFQSFAITTRSVVIAEFPFRIDPLKVVTDWKPIIRGRPYRYAYGTGLRDPRRSGFIDQLVRLDSVRGEARTWHEHGAYPGEPVFVAAPGARAEDDGVILSVVLDALVARSYVLVLDARSLTEIARARVPHHIPFGFHGHLLQTA